MKVFLPFYFLSLFIAFEAGASAKNPPLEFLVNSGRFIFEEPSRKGESAKLSLLEHGKMKKTKAVSPGQAQFIQSEATKLIWESRYREPLKGRKCTPYVTIRHDAESINICREQVRSTGGAWSLLTSMAKILRQPNHN